MRLGGGLGHQSLIITVRYAPILISAVDPGSTVLLPWSQNMSAPFEPARN